LRDDFFCQTVHFGLVAALDAAAPKGACPAILPLYY
jgi:hypothetical protein